jgi:uncharacterized protein YraI
MRLFQLLSVGLFLLTAQAAEETAVVSDGKINVRGQPSLIGEVITQLEQGEKVTVLERLTNTVQRVAGEPTNWARIKLPPNTPVWVFAPFVKDGAVAVSRLNVRAGRGENYSVIGRLNRGEEVKAIRTVEEWIEIEPPTNAYAFVDLTLLRFGGEAASVPTIATGSENTEPATPATTTRPATETTTTPVVTAPVATEAISNNTAPAVAAVPANTTAEPTNNVAVNLTPEPVVMRPDNPSATVTQPEIVTAPPANAEENKPVATVQPETAVTLPESSALSPIIVATTPDPTNAAATGGSEAPVERRVRPPGKRIVRREGLVRATTSIQAPTWYELVNAETKKRINYLFGDNLEINLKDYRGQRVVVSGEELIDSRWPNTPIMDLQSLDVLPDDSR